MILAFFETLARLAPLGTFIVAVTAITVAMRQWKTVRQNEAMKQYMSYLDDCMKHPELAIGKYDGDSLKFYNQFLNKALWAHETILKEFSHDLQWKSSTLKHLTPHIKNILKYEKQFKELGLENYSKDIHKMFEIVKKDLQNEENYND